MKKIFTFIAFYLFLVSNLQAQTPFEVQLVVDDPANTISVKLRNVLNNQPTTSQTILSINMRLLGQVNDIISIASTNYTMLMPSTAPPNTQVITMSSTGLPSPENWLKDQWVTVVVYNLSPGTYTASSFSIQPDLNGNNSDPVDPVMSVAAAGVFNIPLTLLSTVLPVELTSFDVEKKDDNEVLLKWNSAAELNFDRYEIEKSNNGVNFQSIGKVRGKGSGTYFFSDKNPFVGVNYYRLKMIDLEGEYNFSPVKVLSFESKPELIIYPNPTTNGNISFYLTGIKGKVDLSLNLMNSTGQLIKSSYFNNVSNNEHYMTNLEHWPGVYLLRMTLSNGLSFKKKILIRE